MIKIAANEPCPGLDSRLVLSPQGGWAGIGRDRRARSCKVRGSGAGLLPSPAPRTRAVQFGSSPVCSRLQELLVAEAHAACMGSGECCTPAKGLRDAVLSLLMDYGLWDAFLCLLTADQCLET